MSESVPVAGNDVRSRGGPVWGLPPGPAFRRGLAYLRRSGLAVGLIALALLPCGCGAPNQLLARTALPANDRADLDAGNLAAFRDRYEQVPPDKLPLHELALLCDVLLKYQDLGGALDCIDQIDQRATVDPAVRASDIGRAVPGKKAVLALAIGRPEQAEQLSTGLTTPGGRYVHALAALRAGRSDEARATADQLRRGFEPGPVFDAASLYAALGNFPAALAVLENPAYPRLLRDYGLSGHADVFGNTIGTAVFRLDPFDEFDFGVFGKATLAPAANPYVEYLAALSYLRTGNVQEAARRYDTLLAFRFIDAYRDVKWRALTDRAELAGRAGDFQTAERLLREAVEVIESVRGSIGAEAARIAVAGDKELPYRRLIDLLVRRGATNEALLYTVRAQSHTLVELLATRTRFGPPTPAAQAANQLLAAFDRAIGEAQLAVPANSDAARVRLRAARRQLVNDAPDVADLVTVEPPDLAQLQRSIGPGQVDLVFFQGERQWQVFTLTPNRLSVHTLANDDVVGPATALLKVLSTNQDRRSPTQSASGGTNQDWQGPAAALYRSALGPALEGVDATSLVIVPGGVLHHVPFAAVGEDGRFLVDRYAIRVVPNLQLLTRPATRRASTRPLVIGAPLYGDPKYTLPAAAEEAQAVAQLLPGSTLLMEPQATVARVIELAASHDMIHFAGHALYDPEQPLQSGLALVSAEGKLDMLTAARLYDMQTPASLAFLSACETGLGEISGGQDVIGLQRGFFFAGVQTVIGSLWPVADDATKMLAIEFYRVWMRGESPSRALQSAQITTRRQFPHPSDWSAFYVASVGTE